MKKIILILLILFFIPLISSAATFGYTTKGGTGFGVKALLAYIEKTSK